MQSSDIHPQLHPLLPLLFIAWNDKSLSPTEIVVLKEKITALPNLDAEQLEVVSSWLDPSAPPSDQLLKCWLDTISASLSNMKKLDQASFLSWGNELGRRMQGENRQYWDHTALSTLLALEKSVGLVSSEPIFSPSADIGSSLTDTKQDRVTANEIHQFLEGNLLERKEHVFRILKDPVFSFVLLREKNAYREKVLEWCRLLADQGWGGIHFPEEVGGENDMPSFAKIFETIGYHDLSLVVKFGVQFGLLGGAIAKLGTGSHHQSYLKKLLVLICQVVSL